MQSAQDSRFDHLRKLAEAVIQQHPEGFASVPKADITTLLTEIQTYQIELELQNEELRKSQRALEESKERLASLFHNAPVGYIVVDANGMIADVNHTFCRMLQAGRADLLQKPLSRFIEPADRPSFLARLKSMLKAPEGKSIEVRVRDSQNGCFPARVEGRGDHATETAGFLSGQVLLAVSDITESVTAREREAQIKRMLHAVRSVNQLIVQAASPAVLIEKVCQSLTETLGYHNAWIALMDADGRVAATASAGFNGGFSSMRARLDQGRFPTCMQTALGIETTAVVRAPDLECTDCPLSAEYFGRAGLARRLYHGGRCYGILAASVPGAYADDAEARGLFEELADDLGFGLHKMESDEQVFRLTRIINTIPQPMAFVSPDHRYLAVNDVYAEFYDVEKSQILGRPVAEFCGQAVFDAEIRPHLDRCLAGQNIHYDVQVDFPGKGRRWMAMHYFPYRDAEEAVSGIVSHGLDITDRSALENQLRQAQRMEAIGALAGGIAHDFNNILYLINGMSELLLDDLADESPEYQHVQEILKAGKRGADLVKQILAFSRQKEHQRAPVAMASVLRDVIRMIRPILPSNIHIAHRIEPNCGQVLADPTHLHQIAMNLVTNAYHAVTESGGRIMIELKEVDTAPEGAAGKNPHSGGSLVMTISDDGPGIDPLIRDKIFDPYFTTKSEGKGTGLGLSVVYGIVEEYGGHIEVASGVGRGATVSVHLPVLREPPADAPAPLTAGTPFGREHILLVDDEAAIVNLERQILERFGYTVTARTSSIEALEAFRNRPHTFDLVVTDMAMPNLTGDKLAEKIKAIRPDLPVILCTGFSERVDQPTAMAMGMQGFLMKPVIGMEMGQTVRRVLDEAGGGRCERGVRP